MLLLKEEYARKRICNGCLVRTENSVTWDNGERGGSVVECRTPEREVGGSIPTAAVLCPWARHFTPRKHWLITQEDVALSRHDWKIVDWNVKPQHKQNKTWDNCSVIGKPCDAKQLPSWRNFQSAPHYH